MVSTVFVGLAIVFLFAGQSSLNRYTVVTTASYQLGPAITNRSLRASSVSSAEELQKRLTEFDLTLQDVAKKQGRIDFSKQFVVITVNAKLKQIHPRTIGRTFGHIEIEPAETNSVEVAVVRGERQPFKTIVGY